MGKKDSKKVDKAKEEAKKARQLAKQQKVTAKRSKKETKDINEEDIETILAEFAAKEASRTAVSVQICEQPSPRCNFSMTILPNNELLMYGGEFFDGESTRVFNELYRWNIDKNEWKCIESLNTPPPRCSHQSVCYKDKVYLFGGEYATLDQFHHYRDFWELDLKTNTWTEIKATGEIPTARSGHRMVVWRNYIVLFGGFYEAMRDVRWFNDVFIYSFQEQKWRQIIYKPTAKVPSPRSGVQMYVLQHEDAIIVYGGFAKQKVAGSKKEAKCFEDMWMLNLKPVLASGGGGGSKMSAMDFGKAVWQKLPRKGDYPGARSGATGLLYRNKALLFGGVFDEEGPRHELFSTFYNDLYAFDTERKKWYKLGLKQPKNTQKKKLSSIEKKEIWRLKQQQNGTENEAENENHESDTDDDDEDDDDEDNENIDNQEMFGYINEDGQVVYIQMDDEEENNEKMELNESSMKLPTSLEDTNKSISSVLPSEFQKLEIDDKNENLPIPPNNKKEEKTEITMKNENETEKIIESENELKTEVKEIKEKAELTDDENSGLLSNHFRNRTEPCPRINPVLFLRGNSLFVFGGITELGDIEITLDDCWSLDLNKRDNWKQVLEGKMHQMIWKDDKDQNDDDNSSDDESDDGDDDEDDDDDSQDEHIKKPKSSKKSSKKPDSDDEETAKTTRAKVKGGLRMEMEQLRDQLGTTDVSRTPLSGETLRQFYSRTSEYWASEVIRKWREEDNVKEKNEQPSEKEIKRLGFSLSEERYKELLPILERLNELEKQQQLEEEKNPEIGSKKHSRRKK